MATRDSLRGHYRSTPALARTLVSVVLPTFNRAELLPAAIESVVAQTHGSWELVIVDDGSTDATPGVLQAFARDSRIRVTVQDRGGVSRARNAGLAEANGDVIAFLDSDNVWDPEYLELILAGLDQSGCDIAYCAMRLTNLGSTVGYRGDRFDYDECLKGNYIDINVLCHRRSIVDGGNRFDESLRRVTDWDYVLRIARDADVAFFPFIGARYSVGDSGDRITTREPFMYFKIVEQRHAAREHSWSAFDSREVFGRVELKLCLRIAAPRDNRNEWGDYHFALGVKQALERRGHVVDILFREERVTGPYNIVISMRGLVRHTPVPSSLNVLWNISHPDLLTVDEIDAYDLYFSASLTWPNALAWAREGVHHTLLQATDRARFYPRKSQAGTVEEVLFVGNARGVDRWTVKQAAAAGFPLVIYGTGWADRVPTDYVRGTYLPNERLGKHYADAAVVLNDHWESMRQFGYLSNRVFDVTASGGSLVSDDVPGLTRVFGDGVATVRTADELAAALNDRLVDHENGSNDIAFWVVEHHSFDSRVESLLLHIEDFLFSSESYAATYLGRERLCDLCEVVTVDHGSSPTDDGASGLASRAPIFARGAARYIAIGVLPQSSGSTVAPSSYIRLVQPFTAEIDGAAIDLIRLGVVDRPVSHLAGLDAVVVSGTAVEDRATALTLVDHADELSIPLILDLDEAFLVTDESHRESDRDAPRIDALTVLLESAQEVWASTVPLAESLRQQSGRVVQVAPSSIDSRLWKPYRPEKRDLGVRKFGRLEILWTQTCHDDLASIMPALDDLASDVDFALTVVGTDFGAALPGRAWLRTLSPGGNVLYPRYARWLRGLRSNFDIGIAPLAETSLSRFNSDITILEYLALGLIPLASDSGPFAASSTLDASMRIDGVGSWDLLRRLAKDIEHREHVSRIARGNETLMWEHRSAGTAGASLVARIEALIDAQ